MGGGGTLGLGIGSGILGGRLGFWDREWNTGLEVRAWG